MVQYTSRSDIHCCQLPVARRVRWWLAFTRDRPNAPQSVVTAPDKCQHVGVTDYTLNIGVFYRSLRQPPCKRHCSLEGVCIRLLGRMSQFFCISLYEEFTHIRHISECGMRNTTLWQNKTLKQIWHVFQWMFALSSSLFPNLRTRELSIFFRIQLRYSV